MELLIQINVKANLEKNTKQSDLNTTKEAVNKSLIGTYQESYVQKEGRSLFEAAKTRKRG